MVDQNATVSPAASRPRMQNYGIHETPEGLMSWAWAEERLTQARNYWISSTRPDGRPHAAPVWGIWLNGALYFGSDPGSRKARNLEANPNAVMHLESGDEVVILEGKVGATYDVALYPEIQRLYLAKYNIDLGDLAAEDGRAPMYVFRPESGMTWLETDFPNTATRWTFGAK
ncbi:MAG TPA: pyridoxamine 5'-phosphate oxidase family protein [Aggregatilineales bacterium]|jgi:hypothetical protein|nr:pyridoxamine 5'-phosphate oxidase family protein [Aggregatilineales bacterium]